MVMDSFYNVFVNPFIRNLTQPFWGAIASGIGGMLSGRSSRPKSISADKIKELQKPTQDLVDRQISFADAMMDPRSEINMMLRNFLAQKSAETGAQIGSQVQKIGAMQGVAPAQTMMQARIGMGSQMGNVDMQLIQALQNQQFKGMNLLQNMTPVQQGLNENLANINISNVDMQNRNQFSTGGSLFSTLGSALTEKGI